MSTRLDRRGFIKTTGLALAATALPAPTRMPGSHSAARSLRIAHFTDVHMDGSETAQSRFRRCLEKISKSRADLTVDTGDAIMDSLYAPKEAALAQWASYKQVLSEVLGDSVVHVLGNHDIWGWGFPEGIQNKLSETDPQFGKQLALDELGLESRYSSLDKGGWRLILLDSMSPASPNPTESLGIPYIGRLDDEQFNWLEQQMDFDGPVCIFSHIPILSGCELFDGDNEVSGNWVVPGAWVHIDARRLRNLFMQRAGEYPYNPRVTCVSGHTHQLEVLDHLGVRYITNGSVCGDWWSEDGHYLNTPRGYAIVDLFNDGTVESEYRTY